jgi:hypothetical protein
MRAMLPAQPKRRPGMFEPGSRDKNYGCSCCMAHFDVVGVAVETTSCVSSTIFVKEKHVALYMG